jgi:hypothetical protein
MMLCIGPGLHAKDVGIMRDFQVRVLIARRSPDRPRGDYPNDHHRRDMKTKKNFTFNGWDNVRTPENELTLTMPGSVVEFEQARLLKAKLLSCMRRFSILLAQRRSEIPARQEDFQMENVSCAKNGERHAS